MFFKEQIKKRIKNEKGLTLIELLAVIVILAIIAAIAIPAIGNIINNSRDKAVLSEISGMVSAAKIAYADGACTAATATTSATCTFSSTEDTNQIAFTAKKISGGTVTFTDSGAVDKITASLSSGVSFKGKKKTEYSGLITTNGGFTEDALNTKMGN